MYVRESVRGPAGVTQIEYLSKTRNLVARLRRRSGVRILVIALCIAAIAAPAAFAKGQITPAPGGRDGVGGRGGPAGGWGGGGGGWGGGRAGGERWYGWGGKSGAPSRGGGENPGGRLGDTPKGGPPEGGGGGGGCFSGGGGGAASSNGGDKRVFWFPPVGGGCCGSTHLNYLSGGTTPELCRGGGGPRAHCAHARRDPWVS